MCSDANEQFRLSIDKISITFRDQNSDRVQRTINRLVSIVEADQLIGAELRRGDRYHLHCEVPLNGSNQKLLLQLGARDRNTSSYRVEYNPSKIGPQGRLRVRNILDLIFEFGSDLMLMAGKVTRIDVALDLHDLSVDEVLVRHKGMRKFTVVSTGGRPRTLYHGNSRSNQAAIYDKIDNGARILRIEKRLKPNCLGDDLPGLKNPFVRMQLVPVDLMVPVLDGLNLEHLCDSIRLRGFRHVLGGLPSRQRRAIKNVLSDPDGSLLPSPDLIWWRWWPLLYECDLLGASAVSEAAE